MFEFPPPSFAVPTNRFVTPISPNPSNPIQSKVSNKTPTKETKEKKKKKKCESFTEPIETLLVTPQVFCIVFPPRDRFYRISCGFCTSYVVVVLCIVIELLFVLVFAVVAAARVRSLHPPPQACLRF